jgi:hypothetical protein
MIAPGRASIHVVSDQAEQLPVTHARERCVLDHVQVLVELATEFGRPVGVELGDHAVLS